MTFCWGQGMRGAASVHIMKIVESVSIDNDSCTTKIIVV